MKALMLFILMVALTFVMISTYAQAEETSRGNYVTPSSSLTDWLNTNDHIYHNHSYIDRYNGDAEEYKAPLGVGIDVKVLDLKKLNVPYCDDITVQTKYDIHNEEFGAFVVMGIDLTGLYQ